MRPRDLPAGWIKATRTYWTDKRQPTRAAGKRAAIEYDSLEAMKFGPHTYTDEQAETIRLAVANRKPLDVPGIPLDTTALGEKQ